MAMSGNKCCRHTAGIYCLHLGDRVRDAAEHPTGLRTALNNKGISGPKVKTADIEESCSITIPPFSPLSICQSLSEMEPISQASDNQVQHSYALV